MKLIILASRGCLTMILFVLVTGCTHTAKLAVKPADLPPGQKLSQRATLVLNGEFTSYTYEPKLAGGGTVHPFGPILRDYAKQVATHCFEDVQVVPSVEDAAQASASLVLVPRALKTEQSTAVWAWDKVNLTMAVEWVARDRASQNTVWLRTITAEATQPAGNAFTYKKHQRVLMQELFDDLSLKTQAAFQESPELK